MDPGSLVFALILGVPYGIYLYRLTGYWVVENAFRLYFACLPMRFLALYETHENAYVSFEYWHKTPMPRIDYLRAYSAFDFDTAYAEYKKLAKRNLQSFCRQAAKQLCIILFLSLIFFGHPFYLLETVLGSYLICLLPIALRHYRILSILSGHELTLLACTHVHGEEQAAAMVGEFKTDFSQQTPIESA